MSDRAGSLPRRTIPRRQRRLDGVLLVFFAVNLCFITCFVDMEQLTAANPDHFDYPAWPPPAMADLVHGYGRRLDPLLMARPAFWRRGIWIDALWNDPLYVAAIYAIVRGRERIGVPALVWSGSVSAVVLMILAEEYPGVYRSPHFGVVLLLNLPWLALPAAATARLSGAHPFTGPAPMAAAAPAPATGTTGPAAA